MGSSLVNSNVKSVVLLDATIQFDMNNVKHTQETLFILILSDDQKRKNKKSTATLKLKKSSGDAIFISGLPTDIAPKCLSDKLNTIFSSCGAIKVSEEMRFEKAYMLCDSILRFIKKPINQIFGYHQKKENITLN